MDPNLRDIWDDLVQLARPMHDRRRVAPRERDDVIVALCARSPLSMRDLVTLLGRHPDYLRDVLAHLVAAGRLVYRFPERNHPQQRYMAVPESLPDR